MDNNGVVQWILDLGPTVMLPIIITLFGCYAWALVKPLSLTDDWN